jgi:hypothetical protein
LVTHSTPKAMWTGMHLEHGLRRIYQGFDSRRRL